MSFDKVKAGLLINSNSREPDGLSQQPQLQQPEGTTSISITTPCSSSNNNNDEKMVCENSESTSSERTGNRCSQHPGLNDEMKMETDIPTTSSSSSSSNLSNGRRGGKAETVWDGLRVPRNQARLPGIIEDDVKVKNLFRKYKLSIQNETVIVSRIDGILHSTGERSSLYKCHMCGKLGGTLEKLRRHLAAHCRKLPFRCRHCDVRFQLRLQLAFHMKTQHGSTSSPSFHLENQPIEVDDLESNPTSGHRDVGKEETEAAKVSTAVPETSTPRSVVETGSDTGHTQQQQLATEADDTRRKPDVTILTSKVEGKYSSPFSPSSFQAFSLASANSYQRSNPTTSVLSPPPHLNQLHEALSRGSALFTCIKNGNPGDQAPHPPPSHQPHPPLQRGMSDVRDSDGQGMDMTFRSKAQDQSDAVKNADMETSSCAASASEKLKTDLASKIRETEHLGDDVTVVIPLDAPIEDSQSKCGLKTLRPGEEEDLEEEEAGLYQNKIIHVAHHKSILGNSQLRTKRKPSVSLINNPTSSACTSLATPIDSLLRLPGLSSNIKHHTDEFPGHQMVAPPSAAAATSSSCSRASSISSSCINSLPLSSIYNPLALSSFVQGFNGLMSSSLLSPIIAAQTSLGFPGMLVNPLSLYAAQLSTSSLASLMIPKAAAAPANMSVATSPLDCNQRDAGAVVTSCTGRQESPDSLTAAAGEGGNGRIKEELSNSNGSGCLSSSSDGYASPNSKCSSLSRTHSRLNVIQKPIKRENAYKPVIMSDGRTAYHCLYCNKNFCTISDVNRHMDFHEDIRPYKCRFCNYYARTNSQLKVHMMRHQGIREFLCRLCNYKGVTQSDLNRHTKSQIHMMKERNVCTQCREGFVSPMNLEQHRIEKHLKAELGNSDTTTSCSSSGIKYHLTMAGLVKENSGN